MDQWRHYLRADIGNLVKDVQARTIRGGYVGAALTYLGEIEVPIRVQNGVPMRVRRIVTENSAQYYDKKNHL